MSVKFGEMVPKINDILSSVILNVLHHTHACVNIIGKIFIWRFSNFFPNRQIKTFVKVFHYLVQCLVCLELKLCMYIYTLVKFDWHISL